MKKKTFNSVFLSVLLLVAFFSLVSYSYAQEVPPEEGGEMSEEPGSDVPGGTSQPDVGTEEEPKPETPETPSDINEARPTEGNPTTPTNPNTLTPTLGGTATNPKPNPVPAQIVPVSETVSAEEIPTEESSTTPDEEKTTTIMYIVAAAVAAVAVGTFVILKLVKMPGASTQSSDINPNDPCGKIKAELEQKKLELEAAKKGISIQDLLLEKAKKKLKDKEEAIKKDIKNTAKDAVLGKKDSNEVRKAVDAAENAKNEFDKAKGEYEKIKTAIEDLQKVYEKLTSEVGGLEVAYQTCEATSSVGGAALTIGSKIKMPVFSKSGLKLVPAEEKDIATLVTLEKSLGTKKTYSAMVEEHEWKEAIAKEKVFLVKQDGKEIGDVSYVEKDLGHIHISGFALVPDFQGKGFGKKVMELLLANDLFKSAKTIDLVTHPENKAAITLYTSLGFTVGETFDNYFGDGEPRMVMTLKK